MGACTTTIRPRVLFCFGSSMPRITVDLIDQSPQFTNPCRDRELDLRSRSHHQHQVRCVVGHMLHGALSPLFVTGDPHERGPATVEGRNRRLVPPSQCDWKAARWSFSAVRLFSRSVRALYFVGSWSFCSNHHVRSCTECL